MSGSQTLNNLAEESESLAQKNDQSIELLKEVETLKEDVVQDTGVMSEEIEMVSGTVGTTKLSKQFG